MDCYNGILQEKKTMHSAVFVVLLTVICCAVTTQMHTLVKPDLSDSRIGVIDKPASERVKRGVATIIADFLKTAILYKRGKDVYKYQKLGGYTQARADFRSLTGKEIPDTVNMDDLRGNWKSISGKLDDKDSLGFVTIFRESRRSPTTVILIKGPHTIRRIEYKDIHQ